MAGLFRPRLFLGSLAILCATGLRTAPRRGDASSGTLQVFEVSRFKLDVEEIVGQVPTFVDAYLSADGSKAYIVLLTKEIKKRGKSKTDAYVTFSGADWRCKWSAEGEILETLPEAPNVDAHRHTLVVECPTPPGTAWATEMELSLLARSRFAGDDGPVFARDHIHVRNETIFAESETALCTMAIRDNPATPHFHKWLNYNLNLGFDQILLYIEDPNTTWWETTLQELDLVGRVRLVHFYFGEFSDRQNWIMQQAQEQHCLYHAKSRVNWLGHCDDDEYFQPVGSYHRGIKNLLNAMPEQVGAVSVKSQFWFWEPTVRGKQDNLTLEAPCDMTCKEPGYIDLEREKLLMRPETVLYFSVHQVTHIVKGYHTKMANPLREVRVNHFKRFSRHSKHPFQGLGCQVDDTFQKFCLSMVRPPRYGQILTARNSTARRHRL